MYLYIKIHQRARKKTNLIFRNMYFMCIISSQKSEMFLEGRERNISTLKLEIPGSNLMCKWVQWGWGWKCGEPKKPDTSKSGIFTAMNSLPWPLHHHQPSSAASSSGATGSCWISTSAAPRDQLGIIKIKTSSYLMQAISLSSLSIPICRTKFYFLTSAFFLGQQHISGTLWRCRNLRQSFYPDRTLRGFQKSSQLLKYQQENLGQGSLSF